MKLNMNPIPKEEVFEKRKNSVSDNGCADCNSMCCHDLVSEIEKPSSKEDLETYRWYLHFKNSYIFVYDDKWYHMIRSECRFLDKNTMLCLNYEKRSKRCREHKAPNCERYDKWYDNIFHHPDDFEKYIYENNILVKENKKQKTKCQRKKK